MRSIIGELDLELSPRPLALAGQFRLAAPEGENARLHVMPLVVGALLVAPATVLLFAGVLRAQLGFPPLFDVISQNPILSLIAATSLFLGAPVAVVLSLLPIMHWSLSRAGRKIATSLVFRPTFLHLVIAGIALFVVAVFIGHLIADEFACIRGIATAC